MTSPLRIAARFADGGIMARKDMKESPYYDPALAARISRLLGPGFQSAFDPKRKRFLKTDFPITLHGMYTLPNREHDAMVYPYSEDRGETLHDILRPEADTVYSFGVTPSATTLAHEYRHRAGIKDEYTNRLYDALYAETPEDWAQAVEMFRDWIGRTRDGAVTTEEAERSLLHSLDLRKRDLRGTEWDTAPEGEKPARSDPSILGWLSGQRSHYLSAPAPYEKFVKKDKKRNGGLAALAQ